MACRRLALFLARPTPVYSRIFAQMKRGFEACGVEVVGAPGQLDDAALAEFVGKFRPDAVFELNRSRSSLPSLPSEVRHVCWMVDSAERPLDEVRGSDIVYFFGANWLRHYPHRGRVLAGLLSPGFCPTDFPRPTGPLAAPSVDLSFVGHIPAPFPKDDLRRVVARTPERNVTFGELLTLCDEAWRDEPFAGYSNDQYLSAAMELVRAKFGAEPTPHDARLRYDISCRYVRGLLRHRLLGPAVASGYSLSIYGSPNYRSYAVYAPHYRGFLDNVSDLSLVFRSSALNLHEGVGAHFRTFDCIGAGGVLCFLASPDDDDEGGMNQFFEPHRHYVPVTKNEFREQVAGYLADPARRQRMADEAAAVAHGNHTWAHRAAKILRDLDAC